jgi:hypothetical protein
VLPCCHVASVDCAVVALFRCRRSFFAARFMVIAYVKNGGFVVIFFNFLSKSGGKTRSINLPLCVFPL